MCSHYCTCLSRYASLFIPMTVERSRAFLCCAFCMCFTIINKSFVISRFVKRPMSVHFLLCVVCWQAVNSFYSFCHVRCKNSLRDFSSAFSSLRSLSHTAIISIFNNSRIYVFISNSSSKPRMFILCHHNMYAWDFSLGRVAERSRREQKSKEQ